MGKKKEARAERGTPALSDYRSRETSLALRPRAASLDSTGAGSYAFLCAPTCRMADQPHDVESQDNVGTGAEIFTENDVPAIFYDGPDGVPHSGAPQREIYQSEMAQSQEGPPSAAGGKTWGQSARAL